MLLGGQNDEFVFTPTRNKAQQKRKQFAHKKWPNRNLIIWLGNGEQSMTWIWLCTNIITTLKMFHQVLILLIKIESILLLI